MGQQDTTAKQKETQVEFISITIVSIVVPTSRKRTTSPQLQPPGKARTHNGFSENINGHNENTSNRSISTGNNSLQYQQAATYILPFKYHPLQTDTPRPTSGRTILCFLWAAHPRLGNATIQVSIFHRQGYYEKPSTIRNKTINTTVLGLCIWNVATTKFAPAWHKIRAEEFKKTSATTRNKGPIFHERTHALCW